MKTILFFLFLLLAACSVPVQTDFSEPTVAVGERLIAQPGLQEAGATPIEFTCHGIVSVECIEPEISPSSTLAPTLTLLPSATPLVATPTRGGPTSTPGAATGTSPVITPTFPPPTQVGSLPLCADHDPNVWHGLISADGNCHYDHEHKHDPTEGCALEKFGQPGAWFGGNEIGYFWETPDENLHKHEAYGYVVRCDLPKVHNDGSDDGNPNYVSAARVEVHADPMPFLVPGNPPIWAGGYIGTQHSYSLELQICRKADEQCGILRVGGWLNFGDMEVRTFVGGQEVSLTMCAPLPDMEVENCPHGPGGSRVHFDNPGFPPNLPPRANSFFWYGEPSMTFDETIEMVNPMVLALAMGDHMVDVELSDLFNPDQHMFCPAMDCAFNGSTISLHEISMNISAAKFDGDSDGFADGYFLVDQYFRGNSECMASGEVTSGGLMCIPFVLEQVPVGMFEYGDNEELMLNTMGERDFDLSPAFLGTGTEWWIAWPVKMLTGGEHGDH